MKIFVGVSAGIARFIDQEVMLLAKEKGNAPLTNLIESKPEWHCIRCKRRHYYICLDDDSGTCHHLRNIDSEDVKAQQRTLAYKTIGKSSQTHS